MDPTTLAVLLAAIPIAYDIAKEVVKAQLAKPDDQKKAIEALTMAVGNTEAYLSHLRTGGQSVEIWERRLSQDWRSAHRAVDAALQPKPGTETYSKVKALEIKSFYWRDPSAWSDADIERAKIGLSTIKVELAKFIDTTMLQESSRRKPKAKSVPKTAESKRLGEKPAASKKANKAVNRSGG